tara:strand:- start:360 stop:488 length:129 start_codon:yes stop_codon:yes gene_type:complete
MRIFLSVVVILVGANLLVNVLNSEMLKTIEQRNERLEQLMDG